MATWADTWDQLSDDEKAAVTESVQARSDELLATGGDTSWVKTGSDLFDPETGMPKTYIPGEIAVGDTGATVDPWGQLHPEVRELEGRRTPDAFQAWKEDMGYDEYPDGWSPHGSMSLWELFDSALRVAGPGGVAGNPMAGDRFGSEPEIEDPVDYTTTDEFRELKSGFLSELTRIGLETDIINELWDWVEGEFVADASFSTAQAMVEIYEQEAFKRRFPGITTMREDTGRRDIPTPGEYLARERLWATYLGEYGMTALGADLNTMVAESYINAIGEGEFVDRLTAAREMIYEAPEAVKNTFGDWFGNHADAALMAVFLDPSKQIFNDDWVGLKGDIAAAEVGGWSKMHLGLDAPVTQERSRAISKLGWRDIDVWDTLDLLKAKEDLFVERIGEVDYQMEVEGVAAEFGINTEELSGVELAELLDRRGARRTADFSGGGGAMLTGTTTGFGAANA